MAREAERVRDRPIRRLIAPWCAAIAVACALASGARADGPRQTVTVGIQPPESLHVGDRASAIVVVRFSQPNDRPLLVTPANEGPAVEVVRGRLLRADADDATPEELRFRVPLVARTVGATRLRVHVAGWACERACRAIEADADTLLRVRAAEPGD